MALVRGVGHMKQHILPKYRSNPFVGPYSAGKRPIWAYRHIRPLGFVDVAYVGVRIPQITKIITFILGQRVFVIVMQTFWVYLYVRYVIYMAYKLLATYDQYVFRHRLREVIKKYCGIRKAKKCGLF